MESIKTKAVNSKESSKKKTFTVEKIENGWLTIINLEWKDKNGWQYETKKYFSIEEPFDDSVTDKFSVIKNALNNS